MKSILFSIVILCFVITLDADGATATRTKRADCSSKFEAWSDWSKCSLNCGFCGRQNRTRTCIPVSGCSEPICTGDSVETQSCGSGDKICFYPNPNCCDLKYKKTLDLPGKRFYCALREKSRSSVNSTFTTTSSDSESTTPAMSPIASDADSVTVVSSAFATTESTGSVTASTTNTTGSTANTSAVPSTTANVTLAASVG